LGTASKANAAGIAALSTTTMALSTATLTPLFDPAAFPGNGYNEAFHASAQPREPWQPLLAALAALGPDLLDKRQERIRRMRHEDGATYNLFDDPDGKGTPWALDLVPLPLTAAEWEHLETGLIQRANLLDQVLADIYGPQHLLQEGRIPSELVFANPRFLRACHGIVPAANRHLAYYAVDLYRGTDGAFRVLKDHCANPAGLGYALENRIVISRVFSELYHQTQIRRLAPFFQTFHSSFVHRASHRREDPGIVLLTPGPDSRIYFEHALLSRYLGYPLVEGQDLTVRNGEVFLKKLAGLEPVEVILRHTEDAASDPFGLRQETATGVSGLVQVSREQNIDLVNPIGSGFAETPALAAILPDLCRRLMGHELLLANHPAWWCGTADSRRHVMSNLGRLTVGPAMDRSVPAVGPADLVEAINTAPHAFMAREPVVPATVPVWGPNGPAVHHCLLRIFLCATDQGFAVMPGGLAITAAKGEDLADNHPERQQSKDIWVLSDQPVEPFSLMGGLQSVSEVKRGSDLPSRVADHLLWLGRYLERAEGLIRLLRSIYRRLSGEARLQDIPELPFLLRLLRAGNDLPRSPADGGAIPRYRELSRQLDDALYRSDRPGSIIAVLKQVQEAARNVRDRLSLDSWRAINRLDGFGDTPPGDPLEHLNDTLFTLSAFSGLAMESMTRGLGWRFMDLGRRVERALNQTHLIQIALPEVCIDSGNALEALLEVSDSIMTYRARYRTSFQLAPVLDLLIVDESNPKSLAFQCSRLAAHVEHLPRQNDRRFASPEERKALEMLTAVRLLDLSAVGCAEGGGDDASLVAFLDAMDTGLKAFSQQISAHYLTRVPATPHFSARSGDGGA
jgi:uncharacterized circularly permuted ATP-grasp superfamily protein/uncharacterized alpha-E superfamily protein